MEQKAKKILVIDDDDGVRRTLCDGLRDCGYLVWEAENGEQAMRRIDKGMQPDMIVTDIIMPDKSGIQTIMEIRDKYPDIKLLAISGGGHARNVDYLEVARKMGAHAIMHKPIKMKELEDLAREMVGESHARND
ncbi:MAG: response regulator [Micavibrio aeruginosavorus]|uniref:Response regulator n=1 Tax=Micavibrio aeruginosavorus TaxID=349221 RepID=A0A7T5R0M6_9BACT|nr:MAG: response regulator [Micavibrio aeruginosavorus]